MSRPGLIAAVGAFVVVAAGCPGRPPRPIDVVDVPPPTLDCPECDLTHPLNAVLASSFVELGLTPHLASNDEVCRRAGFDLVGRPLTSAELAACVGSSDLDAAFLALQGTEDYLENSQRHWADRIGTDDVVVDFRATVALYDRVDALHRGELRYDEFVVDLLRQSGLINADFTGRERVRRVFRAVLLRRPNAAEETALAGLWRPWLIDFGGQTDPEFPIPRNYGYVMAGLCEPLARCSTDLWGGAVVDLGMIAEADRFIPIYEDELAANPEVNAALGAPGELFARQPETYEAQADAILDRFLDWDEGERDIRTPGFLFPAVRAVVADLLQETGDVPAAERMVLTSLLYIQTNVVTDGVTLEGADDNRPHPLSVGPTKPITGEAWIASLQSTTSYDYGTCDPRFSDGFSYSMLYQSYVDGLITAVQYNELMPRLLEARRDRGRLQPIGEFSEDGVTELLGYDYGYTFVARSVGGCPGFGAVRTRPAGVAFGSIQDGMAEILCVPELLDQVIPAGRPSVDDVVDRVFQALLQRAPTPEELDDVDAGSGCGGLATLEGECSPGELASRLCVSLAGTSESLFR
ncbi:MAG: hypothetical protein Q8O67_01790 [Deltaproteobacteria bacterium]|nr:hypothetical protein [Deltaproteobacteria bacterium]